MRPNEIYPAFFNLGVEYSTELTFIVCVRDTSSRGSDTPEEVSFSSLTMIGDVNLFLKGLPSDEDFEVEAEIMIAGTSSFLVT